MPLGFSLTISNIIFNLDVQVFVSIVCLSLISHNYQATAALSYRLQALFLNIHLTGDRHIMMIIKININYY